MMKSKLVRGMNYDETAANANGNVPDGYVNHVIKVLKQLVDPWVGKVDTVVAEYSYFSSMKYSEVLEDKGLGVIGVFK